jgi:hypothetical protein
MSDANRRRPTGVAKFVRHPRKRFALDGMSYELGDPGRLARQGEHPRVRDARFAISSSPMSLSPPRGHRSSGVTGTVIPTAIEREPDVGAPGSRSDVDAQRSRNRALLAAAIALGVLVRLVHALPHDFALNDGALFYQMALEIKQSGFALPSFTAYNADAIPFAYAPFGFYLAALVGRTPDGILAAVRWIPIVAGCLMLPAFVLLARAVLRSERQTIAATFAFALVPRSFLWIIMGGGLTRSLGLLFTILALWQAHALYTRRSWWHVPTTAVLASLVVLSHLGTAPFLAASIALLWLVFGRHRHGTIASIAVGVLVLLITAPWWATVIAEHGLAPFRAAQATGGSFLSGSGARWQVRLVLARLGMGTMSEPLFPIVLTFGLVGVLIELTRRRFLLPAWWVLTLLVDLRAPGTYASLPIGMLAGIAVTDMLVPLLRRWRTPSPETIGTRLLAWVTPTRWTAMVVSAVVGYATFAAVLRSPSIPSELHMLESLDARDRAAMRWLATATPRDSRVLVITGSNWAADRIAEWLPVLAARKSVATVQGSEWLPGGEFDRRTDAYVKLSQCATRDVACVEQWATEHGKTYSHLYVAKTMGRNGRPGTDCCTGVLSSALADPRFERVYDGPGATVFVRR